MFLCVAEVFLSVFLKFEHSNARTIDWAKIAQLQILEILSFLPDKRGG